VGEFNNFKSLMKEVQKICNQVNLNKVADIVVDEYKDKIQEEVYNQYSPTRYHRRSSLTNDTNISREINENTLEVKNIAIPDESIAQPQTPYNPSDSTQFMKWIEYGQTYNGKAKYLFHGDMSGEPWANPRPATEKTIENLNLTKKHVKAMKDGLRERGFNVE